MTLDPNLTLVIIGVIGIIVPLSTLWIKFVQDNRIAKGSELRAVGVAAKAEQVAAQVEEARVELLASTGHTGEKLDQIHSLVNSRLSEALTLIEGLKTLLMKLAPQDKRVKRAVSKGG